MKMNIFQVVVLAIFAVFIMIGVIIFASYRSSSITSSAPQVTIWGTISSDSFGKLITKTSLGKTIDFKISYVEKDSVTFNNDLVEAILNGNSPDLFFLSQDSILEYKKRIFLIPYKSFPERTFRDTFVEGAEMYLTPVGIVALPVFVDPLVMYWNRDIFTNAGIASSPKYWDEFYDLADKLTQKNDSLDIKQSAFALGEFANISNAKELISALMVQAGTSIVENHNGVPVGTLGERIGAPILPAVSALNFYTQFADPSKSFYSWSRSLPSSLDFFLAGKLGLYFGFASELPVIRRKNPNLNFDVAPLPQSRDGVIRVTFGKFQGLAIAKFSKNPAAALKAAIAFTNNANVKAFSDIINLPPPRRDLLSQLPTDAYLSLFYNSALISRAWLDPDTAKTSEIFRNMVESVTSGRGTTGGAVSRASNSLNSLLSSQ